MALYIAALTAAIVQGLGDAEIVTVPWVDLLDDAPAAMLGISSALGLLTQFISRRQLDLIERRHRRWIRLLLIFTLGCAIATLASPDPFINVLPDYLLLGFFCVILYYRERLIFFDLLIKQGTFFALALTGLAGGFALGLSYLQRLPADWSRPWIVALLLTPFWLIGPWIQRRLSQAIDRLCLGRRLSVAEAEHQFTEDVQTAAGEAELRDTSIRSLNKIFQAETSIQFDGDATPQSRDENGLLVELKQLETGLGWISVAPRPNGIPYMSDDRRLLQTVGRTLGVVLENVRFREQQKRQREREHQLRLLASRAELKALRAQINPHFLFNALNAIAGLIQDKPRLADETVEQLAHVFRYTLRDSENEWVPLNDEVEFVAAYLRVEQARFGDRLHVEFEIDPAAGQISVPAMSIQPLVENAIKHGISACDWTEATARGTVGVRTTLNDFLWVEIFDNGPGFPPNFNVANVSGHGLRNVVERLKGYYGDSAELICDCGRKGARVVMKIPITTL
jgi:signal transduction histidine kinase